MQEPSRLPDYPPSFLVSTLLEPIRAEEAHSANEQADESALPVGTFVTEYRDNNLQAEFVKKVDGSWRIEACSHPYPVIANPVLHVRSVFFSGSASSQLNVYALGTALHRRFHRDDLQLRVAYHKQIYEAQGWCLDTCICGGNPRRAPSDSDRGIGVLLTTQARRSSFFFSNMRRFLLRTRTAPKHRLKCLRSSIGERSCPRF